MSRRAPASVVLSAVLALGACAPTTGDVNEGVQGRAAALGVLQIERAAGSTLDERAMLGAAFARYRGIEESDVTRLLGVNLHRAGESCAFVEPGLGGLESADADVELLDIGTLEVSLGAERARLVARTFPELARVAAGFFYAGEASLGVPTPEVDEYVFRTDGSADVAPVDVSVVAPADLDDVRVDGRAPEQLASLSRGAPLVVSWSRGDEQDVIELELRTPGGTLSCTSADDGVLRIESSSLAQLPVARTASLVVRRVRVQPFDVAGVDQAVARLSSVRTYDLPLR